jgi:phosphotransferase system HPr (HPr) family protein
MKGMVIKMEKQFVFQNKIGLHARPATSLVNLAKQYSEQIYLLKGDQKANAKSLLAILSLGIMSGDTVILQVTGENETDVMMKLVKFFDRIGREESGSFGDSPKF